MAKKQKDDTPTVNSTTNRDITQRINFLYQAGAYLESLGTPSQSTSETLEIPKETGNPRAAMKRTKKRKFSKAMSASDLSRAYVESMMSVGQKTTVKRFLELSRSYKNTLTLFQRSLHQTDNLQHMPHSSLAWDVFDCSRPQFVLFPRKHRIAY